MQKSKTEKSVMVKMLLATLVHYKGKKVTKKAQRDTCKQNVERLTMGLNEAGADVLKSFGDDGYYPVGLTDSLDKKLDDMLVDILGGDEAVDKLYNRVKYN